MRFHTRSVVNIMAPRHVGTLSDRAQQCQSTTMGQNKETIHGRIVCPSHYKRVFTSSHVNVLSGLLVAIGGDVRHTGNRGLERRGLTAPAAGCTLRRTLKTERLNFNRDHDENMSLQSPYRCQVNEAALAIPVVAVGLQRTRLESCDENVKIRQVQGIERKRRLADVRCVHDRYNWVAYTKRKRFFTCLSPSEG